jgi:hypothetical protein
VTVTEMRDLFNQLTDEGTISFVDDDDARRALSRAYKTFRRVVTDSDIWYYATTVDIAVASSQTYNLATGAVTILGATPTNTRMVKLALIEVLDASGVSRGWLRPADQLEDIIVPWSNAPRPILGSYALKGTILYLSSLFTGTLRLHYVPDSTVNWTLDGPLDAEFIDNVPDDLQTLIAYIAYTDYYAPRDGSQSPAIMAKRAELEGSLRADIAGRHGSNAAIKDTFFGGN